MNTEEIRIPARVGPLGFSLDGSPILQPRATRNGEWGFSQIGAPYQELASRGQVYNAGNAAAITWGTALTATGVTFHLCNPLTSKVDLVLLGVAGSIITATTSGTIVLALSYHPITAPATNTAIPIVNSIGVTGGGYGLAFSATTLPATPVTARVLAGAVATVANVPAFFSANINGAICLRPGAQASIQGITIVGTGICSMSWAEVPNQ